MAVQLASQQDLYDLACYLESELPKSCDILQTVVSLRTAPIDGSQTYFTLRPGGGYNAVVGLYREACSNKNQDLQNNWIVSTWAEDEESLVNIWKSIDVIDWRNSNVLIWADGVGPQPAIQSFIDSRSFRSEIHPIQSYSISLQKALCFSLKYLFYQ